MCENPKKTKNKLQNKMPCDAKCVHVKPNNPNWLTFTHIWPFAQNSQNKQKTKQTNKKQYQSVSTLYKSMDSIHMNFLISIFAFVC